MCGPAVETHTVHPPVGHGLISLIQQVSDWIQNPINQLDVLILCDVVYSCLYHYCKKCFNNVSSLFTL